MCTGDTKRRPAFNDEGLNAERPIGCQSAVRG
jgi:hypothetical protein